MNEFSSKQRRKEFQAISNGGNVPGRSIRLSDKGGDGLPSDNANGGDGSPNASLIRSPTPIGEIPLTLLPKERLCRCPGL
jgi:hypothetical protein